MDQQKSFSRKWAEWVVSNRFKVLLGTLVLIIASGAGMSKLWMSSDYQYFFEESDPQRRAFDKLQKVYSRDDNVVIAIQPKKGDVYNKDTLLFVHELTKRAWKVPFSYRVDSLTNFQSTKADEDSLTVRDFVRDGDLLDQKQLDFIREYSLGEPLLVGQIVEESGRVTVVNVRVNIPGKSPTEVPEIAQYVRKMVKEVNRNFPDHEVYLSGRVMMNNAFNEAGQKDMMTLMPLMFLIILIVTMFFLKSVLSTLSTLFILIFSVIGGMGIGGWLGIPITPPSSIAPVVILTLAIADSVHILKSILTYMKRGMSKHDAIIEGMRVNLLPVFLTSVTTAIGFLALNVADTPPLHDLGNITAAGVIFALWYSITLLPVLISLLPIRVKAFDGNVKKSSALVSLGDWVVQKRSVVILVTSVIAVVLFTQVPKIKLSDEFVKYFSKDIEFREHTDWVTKNMTGIYQIHFDLSSKESQGVTKPSFLRKVDDFAKAYRLIPDVTHVNTISDTFKRLNKNMHGDDNSFYKLPDNRELASQYLLLYEMSLPYGLDLNNQIDIDKASTRMIVTVGDVETARMIELGELGKKWLDDNAPEMSVSGTSPTLMFSYITLNNVKSMFWGTLLAFLLITGVMIISLRSWKYGLISILPNIIPAGMAMGLWSLMIGQAGFAISIVGSVTLGIVVDDSVHFLTKYVLAKREKGLSAKEAIRDSFLNVGPALVATSVILTAGFSVMMLSTFKMNWILGSLSAMTIVIALVVDFTFLPALLSYIDKDKVKS